MYVSITADGGVGLREADDCRRLHVAAEGSGPGTVEETLRATGLGSMAEAGYAYLDLVSLRTLAEPANRPDGWDAQWDAMVGYARGKGWLSADNRSVRAHIEW